MAERLPDEDWPVYDGMLSDDGDDRIHRVLGHPQAIQGDMRLTAA